MGRRSANGLPAGIYLDKHGVYWATLVGEHARLWRDRHPGLTLPRRKAATITAAVALQRELIDALKTQRKPRAENPTVAAWVERWIEQRQAIRPNTRKRYLQSLHYQIKPLRIGRIRLRQLSRDLVREWVNELIDLPRHDDPERTLNSYSIRNAFAVLRAALNSAVVDALLVGNPCHKVELPLIGYQEMRFMTSAQVNGLLNVLDTYERVKHTGGHRPHRQAALYHMGIRCGLRKGELNGLRWHDIDWKRRIIIVTGQLQDGKHTHGKSKHAVRNVPFAESLEHVLRRHKENQEEERSVSPEGWNQAGYVFCTEVGTPFNPANVWRQFNEFQLLAKLTEPCPVCNGSGPQGRKAQADACAACDGHGVITLFRFHDLRHTYASLSLAAGVPLYKVSRRMGHSSISVTHDFYGHLDNNDTTDSGAIDRVLEPEEAA